MRKERSACLEVLVSLAVFCVLYFPGWVNASISCDSQPCSLSKCENYSADSGDGFLKSNSLELGKSTPSSFVHDLRLAGGGGSGYKGGSKGSGKGGYQGSKGSGGYKGSQGKTGSKDSKGASDSKGEQDELKEKKEKNENSPTEEKAAP